MNHGVVGNGAFHHLGRKFWVPFVLACGVVFAAESGFDYLMEKEDVPNITQSIFNITGLYERIVGADRQPLERYTAVVKIDTENDAGAIGNNDICGQREQMARMVCRIDRALPKVIVLDKFYGTKECGKANEDLRSAFREVSQHMHVVVGRLVPDEGVEVQSSERYYLAPSLQFVEEPGSRLAEGVVNIDPDTRKLPLQWQLYPSKEDAQNGNHLNWYATLALAAAKGYDDNLLANHPRLTYLLNHHEHPYISFLREKEFESQSMLVSEVLAGSEAPAGSEIKEAEKTFCKDEKPPRNAQKMSGKVVVIGEVDRIGDMHQSVVGKKLPGYLMQANFIEALLDDRYYRAMPVLDYVYGFAILLILELILILYGRQWTKMIVLIAGLLAVSMGVLYLTVKLMHWYVNPVPVSATAIFIKILHSMFGPAEDEV